jgi:hypothetical protein
MNIAYLKPVAHTEVTKTTTRFRAAYSITDEHGVPLIGTAVYVKLAEARSAAKALDLTLLEPPMTPRHLEALLAYRKHYGAQWKKHLRTAWLRACEGLPADLRTFSGLLQQLRNDLGPQWLLNFTLPEA